MKLNLLREYIDLKVTLEIKRELAAAEDYYDDDVPRIRRKSEEVWKELTDVVEVVPETDTPVQTLEAIVELSKDMKDILERLKEALLVECLTRGHDYQSGIPGTDGTTCIRCGETLDDG